MGERGYHLSTPKLREEKNMLNLENNVWKQNKRRGGSRKDEIARRWTRSNREEESWEDGDEKEAAEDWEEEAGKVRKEEVAG